MIRLKGVLPQFVTTVLTLLLFFVLPFFTLIGIEAVVRDLFDMSISSWLVTNKTQVVFNYLLLLSLGAVLYILPRRLFYVATIGVMSVMMLFGIANRYKLEFRSTPITLDDFELLDELAGLEFPIELNITLLVLFVLLALVLLGMLLFIIKSPKERYLFKLFVCALGVVYLSVVFSDRPFSPVTLANIKPTLWKLETGLMTNGVVGNFIVLAKEPDMEVSNNYSEEIIIKLYKTYQPDEVSGGQPNVVFIMSESFFDPFILGENYFKKDPIPNFRKFSQQSLHGTLFTPEFGGGTANVEFEALTGFSTQFMRSDQVAFQQFVKNEIPAIPYIFKDAGYSTTAIHAYFSWFYQRDKIYKRLGFDRFYSAEFMELKEPVTQGGTFPNDGPMTDAILETLNQSEEPDFIHAVSTEAHVPYWSKEESEFVNGALLPEGMKKNLQFYVEKIHSADVELGRLLENLVTREEETLVVFWGDHFPSFPNNNELYGPKGTGLVTDMRTDYQDYLKVHGVPYFIWSSKTNTPKNMDISPSFIPSLIVNRAKVTGNQLTEIGERMIEDGSDRVPYSGFAHLEKPLTTTMKDLKMVQYDWLHGEQYAKKVSKPLHSNDNYHLGLYSTINLLDYKKSPLVHEFLFLGAPKFSNVLINQQSTDSFGRQYLGYGVSRLTIPIDKLQPGDTVQLVVFNSRNRPLIKSEEYSVD